jgi:hypothetical protein
MEKNEEKKAKYEARIQKVQEGEAKKWRAIDLENEAFKLAVPTIDSAFARIVVKDRMDMADIFQCILPKATLEQVWNSYDAAHWAYGTYGKKNYGTLGCGRYNEKLVYTYFAVYFRIVARQAGPKATERNERPLREAIREALDYFGQFECYGPKNKIYGYDTIQKMFSKFYFRQDHFEAICKNFQSLIASPGSCLCGDEKLLHFTGDSVFIKLVPNKPDKVGLWFFELVCRLPDNSTFLLHTKLHDGSPEANITVPVSSVVKSWCSIAEFYAKRNKCPPPFIVFDSYYTDQAGRQHLNDKKVSFIGSVQKGRFQALEDTMKILCLKLDKPGQTRGIYNETTKELFVRHWDVNSNVGKKYCLTNAFIPSVKTKELAGTIPGYSTYKTQFSGCDTFNRNLHGRTFPFRTGGGGKSGDQGIIHKFMMSCILQNCVNVFRCRRNLTSSDATYADLCDNLATGLIIYAYSE